jgi:segregation and condensation protein B
VEITEHKAILEGLLFASGDEGITCKQISKIIEVPEDYVVHILEELRFDYESEHRGVTILESNQQYYMTTKPEHSSYYKKMLETPMLTKLSQAALETLAIIAYRQPITRTEIEEIRGVKSDRPVQTLIARMLIEEVGRREGIGRPVLFATTKEFLTFFGLTSLEELPPLPEVSDPSNVEEDADLFFKQFNEKLSE